MSKKVIVTGAAGFVGRAFCRRLTRDGWQVTAIDNMSTGTPYPHWHDPVLPHGLRFESRWDVRNGVTAMDDPDDYDLVVHCAAVVGGRLKIDGDPIAVGVDLAIDASFWNWVVRAKRKPRVIYFSSSAVYPVEFQQRKVECKLAESMVHFDGNKIGMPDQTYGFAKLAGEFLAKKAVEQYGARAVIYRPFSGYGEDQSLDYPFPSIIQRVVRGDDPITIWGSGDQVRDFIHIDDIVDCVLQTMDVLKPGEVLNLGSGVPTSFIKLAKVAYSVIGGEWILPRVECDTSKPEGVFYRVADTSKMNQFYKPKVSLEEGIRRVAAHLRK